MEVHWLVLSRVISRVTIVITSIRGLATPLITTHEPPSTPKKGAPTPLSWVLAKGFNFI